MQTRKPTPRGFGIMGGRPLRRTYFKKLDAWLVKEAAAAEKRKKQHLQNNANRRLKRLNAKLSKMMETTLPSPVLQSLSSPSP
jgi:hypothetical protein